MPGNKSMTLTQGQRQYAQDMYTDTDMGFCPRASSVCFAVDQNAQNGQK